MTRRNKPPQKRLPLLILLIFLLFVLFSVLFTVDEIEYGIITRFGRPLNTVLTPGLHAKLPWPIDKVLKIDKRVLVLEFPSQSLLTFDQKNVLIDPFLIWRITDPILFAATVRNRATAESRLSDVALAELAILVGQAPFNGFINLEASNIEIHKVLTEGTKFINQVAQDFGISVDDLVMKSFLFPLENRLSVIQRMQAERGRIAAVYRSLGVEEALKIEAQAAAEHEKILGQAHADSIAIRGKGEAEALKILAEAYNKDPQFYQFIRSLESYEAIIGKQSTVFLEANSPLLKYFNGTEIQELQK